MSSVRWKHIRSAADGLLAKHGVRSAPVPVDQIAEAMGIWVVREPGPDDLSGFILKDPAGERTVIGVNAAHARTRQRFTIAHELGHFLLHEGEPLHIDRRNVGFRVKWRDPRSRDGTDPDEREANLFAAELLMPARFLETDLPGLAGASLLDDGVIAALAKKYEVSSQALTLRIAYLGYVGP